MHRAKGNESRGAWRASKKRKIKGNKVIKNHLQGRV